LPKAATITCKSDALTGMSVVDQGGGALVERVAGCTRL
jgi:hypothetical protein